MFLPIPEHLIEDLLHAKLASPQTMAASPSGPSTSTAEETLDERVARRRQEHACLRKFDELMFCLSARAPAPPYARMSLRVNPPAAAGENAWQ